MFCVFVSRRFILSNKVIFGRCVPSTYLTDGITTYPNYVTFWHFAGQDVISSASHIVEIILVVTALCLLMFAIVINRPQALYSYCIILSLFLCSLSVCYLGFRLGRVLYQYRKQKLGTYKTETFYYPNDIWANILGLTVAVVGLAYAINRFQINHYYKKRTRGFSIRTSKCLLRLPKLLTQPIWTLFLVFLIFLYSFFTIFFMRNCEVLEAEKDSLSIKYAYQISDAFSQLTTTFIFLISMWSVMILKTSQQVIAAGSVYEWYFCNDKSTLFHPITKTVRKTVFCNFGSVIACSLNGIIPHKVAIYIANKTTRKSKCDKPNEKTFKKATYTSYFSPVAPISLGVFKVIKPTNICGDSYFDKHLFDNLVLQCFSANLSDTKSLPVNKMIQYVHGATKHCFYSYWIAATSFAITLSYFLNDNLEEPIYNETLSLLIFWITSAFVCDTWLGVLNSTVDALALCLYEDIDKNDGESRPYFSSRGTLYRVLGAKVLLIETKSGIKYKKKLARLSRHVQNQISLSEARLRVFQRANNKKTSKYARRNQPKLADKVRAFNLTRHHGKKQRFLLQEIERCFKNNPVTAKLVSEEIFFSEDKKSLLHTPTLNSYKTLPQRNATETLSSYYTISTEQNNSSSILDQKNLDDKLEDESNSIIKHKVKEDRI